jgi:hypothetical protein
VHVLDVKQQRFFGAKTLCLGIETGCIDELLEQRDQTLACAVQKRFAAAATQQIRFAIAQIGDFNRQRVVEFVHSPLHVHQHVQPLVNRQVLAAKSARKLCQFFGARGKRSMYLRNLAVAHLPQLRRAHGVELRFDLFVLVLVLCKSPETVYCLHKFHLLAQQHVICMLFLLFVQLRRLNSLQLLQSPHLQLIIQHLEVLPAPGVHAPIDLHPPLHLHRLHLARLSCHCLLMRPPYCSPKLSRPRARLHTAGVALDDDAVLQPLLTPRLAIEIRPRHNHIIAVGAHEHVRTLHLCAGLADSLRDKVLRVFGFVGAAGEGGAGCLHAAGDFGCCLRIAVIFCGGVRRGLALSVRLSRRVMILNFGFLVTISSQKRLGGLRGDDLDDVRVIVRADLQKPSV